MIFIHENEVNKIVECYLLHDIINPFKCTNILISINLPFYMYVLIIEWLKQSLRTFESYWIVDVIPRF